MHEALFSTRREARRRNEPRGSRWSCCQRGARSSAKDQWARPAQRTGPRSEGRASSRRVTARLGFLEVGASCAAGSDFTESHANVEAVRRSKASLSPEKGPLPLHRDATVLILFSTRLGPLAACNSRSWGPYSESLMYVRGQLQSHCARKIRPIFDSFLGRFNSFQPFALRVRA